jgi:phage shock protein PspC (stress-responsive transcriptional regulator)
VAATPPPLRRTRDDRIVVGVCAGLARILGVPALLVRLVALALAVAVPPLALIAYAGLAVAMPRDDGRALLGGRPEDRRETMVGWILIGVALISLAAGLESSMLGGPGGLVLLAAGIVLVVVHHQRRESEPEAANPGPAAPVTPTFAAPAPARRARVDLPYPGPVRPTAAAAVSAGEATRTMPMSAAPTAATAPRSAVSREPSVALFGLAALLGASMIALVLGALGAFDASARGVAVALGLGALAMTAAAIVLARRRGAFVLIALAGLLALAAAGTAAVGDEVDRGVGERIHVVETPAGLAGEHDLGIGSLTIDVTRGALVSEVSAVRARLGIGELVIRVPEGVGVASSGPDTPEGISAVNAAAGTAPERTLHIDAGVDLGDVRVEIVHR